MRATARSLILSRSPVAALLLPLALLGCADGEPPEGSDTGTDTDSASATDSPASDTDTDAAAGDTDTDAETDADTDTTSPCLPAGAGALVARLQIDATTQPSGDRDDSGNPVTERYGWGNNLTTLTGDVPDAGAVGYAIATFDPPLTLSASTSATVRIGSNPDSLTESEHGAPTSLLVNGTAATGGVVTFDTLNTTQGDIFQLLGLRFELPAAATLSCVGWSFTVPDEADETANLGRSANVLASCAGDALSCPSPLLTAD